jgi:hypothetical protein
MLNTGEENSLYTNPLEYKGFGTIKGKKKASNVKPAAKRPTIDWKSIDSANENKLNSLIAEAGGAKDFDIMKPIKDAKKEKAKKIAQADQKSLEERMNKVADNNELIVNPKDFGKLSELELIDKLNTKFTRLGIKFEGAMVGDAIRIKSMTDDNLGTYEVSLKEKDAYKKVQELVSTLKDDNFIENAKANNPNTVNKLVKVAKSFDVPPVKQYELYKQKELEKFEELNSAGLLNWGKKGNVTIEDFDSEEQYKRFNQWKETGKLGIPSKTEVMKFNSERISSAMDKYTASRASGLSENERLTEFAILQDYKKSFENNQPKFIKDSEDFNKQSKDLDNRIELYKKNPSKEEYAAINATALELTKKHEQLSEKFRSYNAEMDQTGKIIAKVIDPSIKNFKANYNRIKQAVTGLKSTGLSVINALDDTAAYASAAITGESQDAIMRKDSLGLVQLARELDKETESYQKTYSVDEIDSWDTAGSWLASSITNFVPSLAMASTGPAAIPLFFASAYGEKAEDNVIKQQDAIGRLQSNYELLKTETDQSIIAKAQAEIQKDKATLNIPEYKQLSDKVIQGTAEAIFEYVGTLSILKGIGKGLSFMPAKTLKEGMIKATSQTLKNSGLEGLSEFGTTLIGNASDIYIMGENKNLFDGGLESFAQGALMGGGMSAVNGSKIVKQGLFSELANKEQKRRSLEIVKKISELTGNAGYINNQGLPLDKQSPQVQKLVDELLAENEAIKDEVLNRLGSDISIDKAHEIGDINRQARELQQDFKNVSLDSTVELDQLEKAKDVYRDKWNKLMDRKQELLTGEGTGDAKKAGDYNKSFEFTLSEGFKAYNSRFATEKASMVNGLFKGMSDATRLTYITEAKQKAIEDGKEPLTDEQAYNIAQLNFRNKFYTEKLNEGRKNAEAYARANGVDAEFTVAEGDNADATALEAIGNALSKKYGKKVEEFIGDESKEYEGAKRLIKAGQFEGVNIPLGNGKSAIIVHLPKSIERGRTGVFAHEVLHANIRNILKTNSKDDINVAGEKLLSYLQKNDPKAYAKISNRLEAYKDKEGNIENYEEVLNTFSDALAEGTVSAKSNSISLAKTFLNAALEKTGTGFRFQDNADVYKTIIEYNRSSHFGKSSKSLLENVFGSNNSVSFSKSIDERRDELEDKLANDEIDYDLFEKKMEELDLEEEEAKNPKPKVEVKKEEKPVVDKEEAEAEEIVKENKGTVASEKVQAIYDSKGVDGAFDIIKLFKPIVSKLVDKRRDAPGFDKPLMMDELETGKNGLYDLIKAYDPNSGVPLAAYINKYLPVRAIEISRRILAKEFSKEIDEQTTSYNYDAEDDYSFDSTLDEMREEEDRQSSLINPIDIMGEKLGPEYTAAVESAIDKMSQADLEKMTFANLNDLAPEVTAKFFGIPVAKVTNSAANLATPEIAPIQQIIFDNKVKLIKLLPEGAILEGTPARESLIGTGLSIPRKIQSEFYDQKDRLSKGAGLIPYELKKNITYGDFLKAFGINEDGTFVAFGGKDPRAQTMLAMVRLYGKIASNTAVRMTAVQSLQQQADLKAGASKMQFSKSVQEDAEAYIKDETETLQFSVGLSDILDIPREQLYFSELKNIKIGRKGLVKLAKKLGPEKAVAFLSATNRSGWGTFFGGITADDIKQKNPFIQKQLTEYEGKKKYRSNLFLSLGSNDFYNNILKEAFGEVEYKKGSRYVTIKGKKIELPTTPPQNTKGIVDGSFFTNKNWNIDARQSFAELQRKNLKELLATIKQMQISGKLSNQEVGLLLKTFNSSTNSILRTAGMPGLYMKSDTYKKDSDYRYEHAQPASATLLELTKLYFKEGYKNTFEQIMKGYNVVIIPIPYDNVISAQYKSTGPVDANGNLLLADGSGILRYVAAEVKQGFENAGLPEIDIVNGGNMPLSFSKSLSEDFNEILETTQGIGKNEEFSNITARTQGAGKGKFRFFVPPSAEDFAGLLYDFLGKGKKGEENFEFFKTNLISPYTKGIQRIDNIRANIKEGYKALKAEYPVESKKLKKKVEGKDFTYDQAVRVYLWKANDMAVPGLSDREVMVMSNTVKRDAKLREFADKLSVASGQLKGWVEPTEYWNVESIVSDLHNATEKIGRRNILKDFIENSEQIFSPENLNKIEAALGTNYRSALEDSLFRMKNGSNQTSTDKFSGGFVSWIANANGTIMFLNTRSAILQTIAATNYLNWTDNNPVAAGAAFLNQPQYWKDFAMIFNSNKLKERREGLKADVNEAEIANAVKGSKNKAKAALSYLLKIGYTPTQIADSFAIAAGGSTFYRNRVKTYEKQGLSTKEAEDKAFEDFDNATEESQQSSDPSKLSQQQASTAGRLILAFANTPMQYNRLMKKAFRDLINGRGDAKTHVSKILYYGAVQNIVFSALQNALFATLFDDDEEDEKTAKANERKYANILNGMADTILRGTGITGAIVSTAKNVLTKFFEEREKGFKGDQAKTIVAALGISPPIGSKAAKLYSAINTDKIDKDIIAKRGMDVTLEGKLNLSPSYDIAGKVVASTTNFPLDRLVDKVNNVSEVLDSRNKTWQRVALALGWKAFDVGTINEGEDLIRAEAKAEKKEASSLEAAKNRIVKKDKLRRRLENMTSEEENIYYDSIAKAKEDKQNKRIKLYEQTEAFRDSIENSN